MSKKLLVDSFSFKLNRLNESDAGGRKYVFEGKFGQCDVPTSNGRVYSRELMEREINRLKKRVSERKVYGELDHPEDGKTKLQRSAIIIEDIYIDDQGQVMGRAEIMDTSMGKELKAIADSNGSIGVSSRGYGSVLQNEDGNQVVQKDFKLMTYDPVADPAEETAYVETTVSNASPAKNEPAKDPDEDTNKTKDDATDDVSDAPKGNVSTSESNEHTKEPVLETTTGEDVSKLLEDQAKDFKSQLLIAVKEAKQQVRSELMEQISKDPEIGGSKLALEEVKKVIAPFVLNEDTQKLVEVKDAKIKILEADLEQKENELFEQKRLAVQMSNAAKEMGYNYFLLRSLGEHPKYTKIVESLGDFSKIASLADLKSKVSVYVEEANHLASVSKQRINDLTTKSELLREENTQLQKELDEASSIALEYAARVYLERKLTGSPNIIEARKRFQNSEDKTKDFVDSLVESFKANEKVKASDFTSVRKRFNEAKFSSSKTLVEDHVKDTAPSVNKNKMSLLGQSFSMEEFNKLSGQ